MSKFCFTIASLSSLSRISLVAIIPRFAAVVPRFHRHHPAFSRRHRSLLAAGHFPPHNWSSTRTPPFSILTPGQLPRETSTSPFALVIRISDEIAYFYRKRSLLNLTALPHLFTSKMHPTLARGPGAAGPGR